MSYTFSQLKTDCNAILWPNGVPENLTGAIDNLFVEAMVDLQKWIPCMRERHESVFPQCSTYFKCGTTWFDAPKGRITKVYTVQGEYCQPATFHQTTLSDLNCWSRRFTEIVTSPSNTGLQPLQLGFKYPESSTDSTYGRAFSGLWALDTRGSGGRIVLAPWIQSDESVVVEWSGVKQSWSDSDLVDDEPELKKAVRQYVKWMYESLYVCDRVQTAIAKQDYEDTRADLIWECTENTRIRKSDVCYNETRSLYATYVAPTADPDPTATEETTVLAAFGDYGVDNADELAVANLVKGWEPDGILALGDNNYPSGSSTTIDENVGKYFADYIYPYLGSYDSAATENKFWPVLGNHDLDTLDGEPYLDYFPTPINQRYYDKVIGHVHIFALNSGYDTAGNIVETSGTTSTSVQAEWLRSALARSTSKWNIVILHHSPYTNGSTYTPGKVELRWPFEEWGADAVLSGHSHVYERIEKGDNDFKYFVVGTGGRTLHSFIATPIDQVAGQNTEFGALKITATCDDLSFEFITVDDVVVDDGGGGGGYEPPAETYAVYWGRSTNTVLTDVQILALSNSATVSNYAGSYAYVSGTGYHYWAVPDSENPSSIMLGAFSVSLAESSQGYNETSNGLTYTLVTIGSTVYRLYRTYNTQAGAATYVIA